MDHINSECSLHSVPKEEYVCGVPWKFDLLWDEEGPLIDLTIEREPTEKTEFDIKIDIKVSRADEKYYSYLVSYQDFIYAVCKAYTEVILKYGFFGFHHSLQYGSDLQTSQFLYLKAIALNNFEATKEITDPKNDIRYYSNLDEELKLMKFEM